MSWNGAAAAQPRVGGRGEIDPVFDSEPSSWLSASSVLCHSAKRKPRPLVLSVRLNDHPGAGSYGIHAKEGQQLHPSSRR